MKDLGMTINDCLCFDLYIDRPTVRCSKGILYLLWHFERFLYTFTEISDGNV